MGWRIIVTTKGLTTWNAPLWEALAVISETAQVIVVEDGLHGGLERRLAPCRGITHLRYQAAPYVWSQAVNQGLDHEAEERRYTLTLHDDITLPPEAEWLRWLSLPLQDPRIGLVVPGLIGDCGNRAQTYESDLPWFVTTEFVSYAALACRTQDLTRIGGFRGEMTGYDWWGADVQRRLAQLGLRTAVAAQVRLPHAGHATYRYSEALMEAKFANAKAYCHYNGIRCEATRPAEVRIAPPVDSTCVLLDPPELSWDSEAVETFVLDTVPSVARCQEAQARGWWYVPPYETNPYHLGADLAGCDTLTFTDGDNMPITGRRVRWGHFYALPEHAEEVHLGMLWGFGIGDTIMMTPALHALKRRWPHLRTVVHHRGSAGTLLHHNPDVDEVRIYDPTVDCPPPEVIHMGVGNGQEGTVRFPYAHFGLDQGDREYHLPLRAEELVEAGETLVAAGYEEGAVYGVQLHGGWPSKNWQDTPKLVAMLLAAGHWVLTFGNDGGRIPPGIDPHPRLLRLEHQTTIRQAAALIKLLDGFVGFDSGLSFIAAAVGTPLVALYGPHDPAGLVADPTTYNLVALRRKTPQQCLAETGTCCRSVNGGSSCPLREGPGADCIDLVSAEEVMAELEGMPKWENGRRGG